MKAKHTSRPLRASERQDRKHKEICPGNRRSAAQQMENKRAETGFNVCDRIVRNRLNEIGFTQTKAKRKHEQLNSTTRKRRKKRKVLLVRNDHDV